MTKSKIKYKEGDYILTERETGKPLLYNILNLNVSIYPNMSEEYFSFGTHKVLVIYDESGFWNENEISYWSQGEYLDNKEKKLTKDEIMVELL